MTPAANTFPRLTLAVSSCLLGEPVRYDGGHKRHSYLTDVLARCADFVSVCPEAAIGMGVPRPPIQLVGQPGQVRALGVEDPHLDVTDRLTDFARRQADSLSEIDGYIFKKNSPSCGLDKVKLFARPNRSMQRKASGLYAAGFTRERPLLPVAEEDTFSEPEQRDSFMTRAYVYRRWRQLCADGLTARGLTDFHAAHKYLVMAHSQAAYQRLGRLLADFSRTPIDVLAAHYSADLMDALKRTSQRRQHYNVLQHIAGYLKDRLDGEEKAALAGVLDNYVAARCDRFCVIAALRTAFSRHPDTYIACQVYLNPYPDCLR